MLYSLNSVVSKEIFSTARERQFPRSEIKFRDARAAMMVRPVEVHSAHDGFSTEAKDAIHKKGNFLLFINALPASDGSTSRTQFSVPVSKMPLPLMLLHF